MNPKLKSGDTIAIIDGYAFDQPVVAHQEILEVIDSGVAVHGASGIGALRAAELDSCGMIGHGTIFSEYRNGLAADDEIALLHGTEEDDYAPITEALINVRHILTEALRKGRLDHASTTVTVEAARSLPFNERTIENISINATLRGLRDDARQRIFHLLADPCRKDQKQIDADRLLDLLTQKQAHELSAGVA